MSSEEFSTDAAALAKAFNAGCDARQAGTPPQLNPYSGANSVQELRTYWLKGWLDVAEHWGQPVWAKKIIDVPRWWGWWAPKILPLPPVRKFCDVNGQHKNGKVT